MVGHGVMGRILVCYFLERGGLESTRLVDYFILLFYYFIIFIFIFIFIFFYLFFSFWLFLVGRLLQLNGGLKDCLPVVSQFCQSSFTHNSPCPRLSVFCLPKVQALTAAPLSACAVSRRSALSFPSLVRVWGEFCKNTEYIFCNTNFIRPNIILVEIIMTIPMMMMMIIPSNQKKILRTPTWLTWWKRKEKKRKNK